MDFEDGLAWRRRAPQAAVAAEEALSSFLCFQRNERPREKKERTEEKKWAGWPLGFNRKEMNG